jgi:hypothetical protein
MLIHSANMMMLLSTSSLLFMSNKLYNWLTTHLNFCVHMFIQFFYIVLNFPYDVAIATWKEVCIKIYCVDS